MKNHFSSLHLFIVGTILFLSFKPALAAPLEDQLIRVLHVKDGVFTGGSLPTTTPTISMMSGYYEPLDGISAGSDPFTSFIPHFVLWPDGTILWSEDPISGRGSLYTGIIPEYAITDFFSNAKVSDIVRGEAYPYAYLYFGRPGTYLSVIEDSKNAIDMSSNHELEESWYPDEVRLSTGTTKIVPPLTKDDYLMNDSAEYKAFRADWDVLKSAALDLIPLAANQKQVPRDEVDFASDIIASPEMKAQFQVELPSFSD